MAGPATRRQPAVLLISPGIIKWTDMDFGLPHLVAIGGYLQAHLDVRVELLDLGYEGGDHAHLERTLDELGPYLCIGISGYSSYDYMRVMTLARFVKAKYPDVPVITGGYHVSALPEDVLFEGSPFDAAVVGEGEVPMKLIVERLLGGGTLERKKWGPANIVDLDALPPYRWELLRRYWPRANTIGRKLQIYLSRGCPYHCTFCMERAKTEYQWRAYSEERALDELRRLASFTKLGRWVVNLADPLFGFRRRWRRTVLEGIIRDKLFPRQYWTLTRSDDLDDVDVQLLAKARFSIGIGMESGSPDMLRIMDKAKNPERYLQALRRLARLSREHGLNWAANIIVGHPGETPRTMRETRDELWGMVRAAPETCGWLSFDPFRLYPGALVHEQMKVWSDRHGTVFHHPQWWKSWYDAPFKAEHIDPSSELSYEERVRFMYETYGPMTREIHKRFRGQGRSVDRVYERSLTEQEAQMGPKMRDWLLARAKAAKRAKASDGAGSKGEGRVVSFPVGLHIRDPWVRRREQAVRRLLEEGVLRTDALIEALLSVAPERYLPEEAAEHVLHDHSPRRVAGLTEGEVPPWLGLRTYAMGLEGLEPAVGDRVADLTAVHGYVAALLAELVGPEGEVVALHPRRDGDRKSLKGLAKSLRGLEHVSALRGEPTTGAGLDGAFDRLWIGGALPRFGKPLEALLHDEGRAVVALGPRFGRQDLACLVRRGDTLEERVVARVRLPVLRGPAGWLAA